MVEGEHTGIGTASLVLGILGIILMFFLGLFSLPLPILAIIFGVMARKEGDSYGLAGLILGIVTIVLIVVFIAIAAVIYVYVSSLI